MFCQKCGNQMEDGAVFCSKCGAAVNGGNAAGLNPVVNVNMAGAVPAQNVASNSNKMRGIIIAAAAAFLALVIVLIIILVGKNKKNSETEVAVDSEDSICEEVEQLRTELGFCSIGETVSFGTWKGNPCQWIIIKKEGNRALLLSKYFLESYKWEYETNWEESSVRTYLNENLINELFTEGEQTALLETTLKTSNAFDFYADYMPSLYNQFADRGIDYCTTTDKLFLLDWKTVDECFGPIVKPDPSNPVQMDTWNISGDADTTFVEGFEEYVVYNSWFLRETDCTGDDGLCVQTMSATSVNILNRGNAGALRPAFWVEY